MGLKQQLLSVAEAYCAASKRSEAAASKLAFGRGAALKSLRAGKDTLTGTAEAALQWFSDHWPEGAAWPREVPRPAPAPSDGDPSPPAD